MERRKAQLAKLGRQLLVVFVATSCSLDDRTGLAVLLFCMNLCWILHSATLSFHSHLSKRLLAIRLCYPRRPHSCAAEWQAREEEGGESAPDGLECPAAKADLRIGQ